MKPRAPISAAVTRWGMLITTAALGAVLIGMGAVSYAGSRQAAEALDHARSIDLVFSARQAIVAEKSGDRQRAAEELVQQLGGQGLRFVAVVTHKQGLIASAGEQLLPFDPDVLRDHRPGTQVEVVRAGNRIVVVAAVRRRPLPERAAVGWPAPLLERGPDGKKLPKRALKVQKRLAVAAGERQGSGGVLVLEYEPVISNMILSRALAMLLVSVIAATVLVVAAVVFWRLSRRAEEMTVQLARDRQLKMLGEMSAVLGHELRNPLASLKGHAQLLVERISSDHPGRRSVERVVNEAIRMEKLTEQILEFARTGSVDTAPQDPAEVARSSVDESGLAGVDLVIEEGLPTWSMDRLRIERVLINLLKNAVQASPPEGVVDLTVKTEQDGLVFEVRDRGEGLPPGEEEWIFEPFHTKRVRGTGLGLAVSKQIVEAHQGRITAWNHPEGGAVFRVWLPKAEPDAKEAPE